MQYRIHDLGKIKLEHNNTSVMAKKSGKDIQLSFEFDTSGQKIKFISVTGKCKCGFAGEFKKAEIVFEMTVPCPKCGSIIVIK